MAAKGGRRPTAEGGRRPAERGRRPAEGRIRKKNFPVKLSFSFTVKVRSCKLMCVADTKLFEKRHPLGVVMYSASGAHL